MNVKAIHTRLFQEGESLGQFIFEHVSKLADGDVLVITSKIVALAEKRTAPISQKQNIISRESEWAIMIKNIWLTIKDGMFMVAAGVDESNAHGRLILLPKDSFKTAARVRKALLKRYNLKKLGVLITDSRVLPLRAGTIGVAVGYAGFSGIRDYRGGKDLFGRILSVARLDIADSLATTAVLLMGEGDERKPLAIVRGAPVEFKERSNRKELIVSSENDLYIPLFASLAARKKSKRK